MHLANDLDLSFKLVTLEILNRRYKMHLGEANGKTISEVLQMVAEHKFKVTYATFHRAWFARADAFLSMTFLNRAFPFSV